MSETAPASENGIEGVIYVSPSRPGPQRADMPCKAPVANIDFVVLKGEQKVASFATDTEGQLPGHRAARALYDYSKGVPTIGRWRHEVEVVTGKMAQVDWTADSGMR